MPLDRLITVVLRNDLHSILQMVLRSQIIRATEFLMPFGLIRLLGRSQMARVKVEGHHLIIICDTFVTMISGFPLYKVIFPDTATVLPSYCCGFEKGVALAEGIKAVKE
jgi:hypothetical protein